MKNVDGKVNLLMCIIIVLVLTLALFSLVIYNQLKKDKIEENKVDDNTTIVEPTQEENNNTTQSQTSIDNKENFDFSFLKMENNKRNMIYSPLSIEYALKMLQEGANGNTFKQINDVLGNKDLPKYNNIGKNLSLANGIFIRDNFFAQVKEEYKNTLMSKYNAEVLKDAFESVSNVNNWIENKTLGIIKNTLDEGAINEMTRTVLVNALAIDMEWIEKFQAKDTYGKTFYLSDGREMIATTLNKETTSESVSYFKENNLTALSMDLKEYEGQQLEFLAVMPDSNLDEYIKTLDEEKISGIDRNLKKASSAINGVDISIPKFKFDYDLKLKDDLQSLGIKDAFSDGLADFSKISDEKLYVSNAIHKADIEFSEEGIKAAAVTVFTMEANAMIMEKEKPIEITIDKPFLVIIRDKNTKANWFIGTVYEPNSWEKDQLEYKSR